MRCACCMRERKLLVCSSLVEFAYSPRTASDGDIPAAIGSVLPGRHCRRGDGWRRVSDFVSSCGCRARRSVVLHFTWLTDCGLTCHRLRVFSCGAIKNL